ncbi:DUF4031 domain-containing protein [Xanthobacter flavus]|uniref:DUF4031 domain-containing protein n=1 Tax=Xanthobacter flavus TaxID=281 RepID=UPI003728C0C8
MAVYVDPATWPFGRMIMCHMWADTTDELLSMALKIGVQRKWIQGHPTLSLPRYRNASWVHFDICSTKRKSAIHHGAIETDRYGPLEWEARQRIASGKPDLVALGEKRLAQVEACRVGRAALAQEADHACK